MSQKCEHNTSELHQFIFRHYARSAVIPILAIELFLLVVYFMVVGYHSRMMMVTLRDEVKIIMPHLVEQQADLIDNEFENVKLHCQYFAEAHERLFRNPDHYSLLGEQPVFSIDSNDIYYQVNRKNMSSLFFSHAKSLTPKQKEKARITAALDPLYRHMVRDNYHVSAAYFNTHDNMSRIYPPLADSYKKFPAGVNLSDFNFYYLADQIHNPEKNTIWTGVYLDPVGKGWMLSCIAPVYLQDSLVGVVGLDLTTADIVAQVLSIQLPWRASVFLADSSGMLIAMTPSAEKTLGLTKEQLKPQTFNLLKNSKATVSDLFKTIYTSNVPVYELNSGLHEHWFVVSHEVASTHWKLFLLIESEDALHSVNAVANYSKRIGYLLIVVMVAFSFFFFVLLRKKAIHVASFIAAPIAKLAHVAETMGAHRSNEDLPCSGIAELDKLTDTFEQMTMEIDARSRALVESEVRVKLQEKETEAAYVRGMYESASGYLHNVGNLTTQLDSSILDLEKIVQSTNQYPQVFEQLSKGSDPELLKRFRTVFLDKMVPKMVGCLQDIKRVKMNIQQTIRHQQQSYKNSRDAMIHVNVDVAALVREIASSIIVPNSLFVLKLDLPNNVFVVHHRNPLYNGILNVIKNAVESCEPHGEGLVSVTLRSTEQGAVIVISDNGIGILPEHQAKVMSAGFSTKKNGNGFGLHSFAVFLSAHHGKISIQSAGLNKGTIVTIEVNHV